MEDLSSRLKQVRKELNLSQTELSEKLEVQQADISRWESGKTTPNFQTLQKYSSLNVNVSWLFTGIGKIFDEQIDGTTYFEVRYYQRRTNGNKFELFAVEEHINGDQIRREPFDWEHHLAGLASTIAQLSDASETERLVSRQA